MAAKLVELTIEANEASFVIVHQHGGNDMQTIHWQVYSHFHGIAKGKIKFNVQVKHLKVDSLFLCT